MVSTAVNFLRGTEGSNPASSSGESGELPLARPDLVERHPELLAHHLTAAGDIKRLSGSKQASMPRHEYRSHFTVTYRPTAGAGSMRCVSPGSGAAGNKAISSIARRVAILEIGSFQLGDPVLTHGCEFGAQVQFVKPRRIVAKDRALDCAIGRSESCEAMFLLHVLWDLKPTECLDLPLGRAVPHRVRTPEHVIMPEPLDQGPHHRSAEARIRDGRNGKGCADIGIDVADAGSLRNRGEIGHPPDVTALFKLRELAVRVFEERAKAEW